MDYKSEYVRSNLSDSVFTSDESKVIATRVYAALCWNAQLPTFRKSTNRSIYFYATHTGLKRMYLLTKMNLFLLISFVIIYACLISTEARSVRKPRGSSPHIQLHRRRRYLEKLYNQLLVIYRVMNTEENANQMTPETIHHNQPESDVIRNIVRTLNAPEEESADDRGSRNEEERHLDFETSINQLFAKQSSKELTGNRLIGRGRHGGRSGRLNTIHLRNGVKMRIHHELNRKHEADEILLRKVINLCQMVNKKVAEVTSGVKVKSCSLL